jgi:hypothetical protein
MIDWNKRKILRRAPRQYATITQGKANDSPWEVQRRSDDGNDPVNISSTGPTCEKIVRCFVQDTQRRDSPKKNVEIGIITDT